MSVFSPRYRLTLAALAMILGALIAAPSLAQTGAIRVTVLNAEDDTPLPGATVSLTNVQALVATNTLLTDERGRAIFPVLRAGSGYVIDVRMPGFAPQRKAQIRLHSNSTEELEFRLGAPLEERVRVVAGRDLVDIDEVGSSTRFSDEFIENLPTLGRFYQNVLPLAPGVNDEDGDGNPNVHGARSRDFRTEVSGVSNVDPLTGQWLSRVNPDTIEELEVIPRGAGVEFGRAQGGFARVIQKQGSNTFQGTANFLYRSYRFDGNGSGIESPVAPTPEFETVQPAIQFSGPLVKDKLWFRVSHEYIKREDPVNTLGQLEITTREQSLHADQITWQVSPRNKVSLQYQNDPLSQDGLGISSDVPLISTRKLERGGDTWTLNWTAPYSARLLFDATVGWQDHEVDVIPTAPADQLIEQQCVVFHSIPSLLRTLCDNLSTGKTSGPHFEQSLDDRQRLTVKAQGTLYQPWGGQSHRIKFGFIIENERYSRELIRKPKITSEIIRPFIGKPFAPTSVRVALPQISEAKATAINWALYAEDQWKPLDNLSITFGLRFDHEEIAVLGHESIDPSAEAQHFNELIAADGRAPELIPRRTREDFAREAFTAYENISVLREMMGDALDRNVIVVRFDDIMEQAPTFMNKRETEEIMIRNNNVSPRLSLAWDPGADGKTKIAATAGRYFDKIFLAVPLVELEPVETTLSYTGWLHFPAPPFFFETDEQFAYITPLTARMLDRDLRTPFQDEYSLGFERELWPETSLKLTWLKRKFKDQLQDRDINSGPGDFGRCGFTNFFDPAIIASPGSGQFIFDSSTGEFYEDTDPGLGDGRIDDCTGDLRASNYGGLSFGPDGRPDLYTLNPVWRELLLVGNFNSSEYEAVILEIVRRLYRNWQLEASYTWSEAVGDAEDFDLLLGNEQNRRDDERGFLDYHQRHVVKLNFAGHMKGGWHAGTVIRWESGLPYSIVESSLIGFNVPPLYPFKPSAAPLSRFRFPTGQRNDQANPDFWTVDMRLAKDFRLGGHRLLGLSVEVFNLMDDQVLRLDNRERGINEGTRRFGRQWQLGMRVSF